MQPEGEGIQNNGKGWQVYIVDWYVPFWHGKLFLWDLARVKVKYSHSTPREAPELGSACGHPPGPAPIALGAQ